VSSEWRVGRGCEQMSGFLAKVPRYEESQGQIRACLVNFAALHETPSFPNPFTHSKPPLFILCIRDSTHYSLRLFK